MSEFPHDLPNDLRLGILENQEISGKSQNFMELLPSVQSSSRNENWVVLKYGLTHSYPLKPTPIHSHPLPCTATHCHPLPLICSPLPSVSTLFSPLPLIFNSLLATATHIQPTLTQFKPTFVHVQPLSPTSSHVQIVRIIYSLLYFFPLETTVMRLVDGLSVH